MKINTLYRSEINPNLPDWLVWKGWRSLGLSRPTNWGKTMLVAALGGIGYALLDELLFLPALMRITASPSDLSPFEVLRGNLPRTLVMMVLSWTLVAFGEEIFFRGFLLQGIANLIPKLSGRWIMAVLLSAALFSITHFYQGIIGVGNAFLAGIFLGFLFVLNGRNLWLPVLTHGVINTVGFLIIYLGIATGT
jgi:uncharacterized protein